MCSVLKTGHLNNHIRASRDKEGRVMLESAILEEIMNQTTIVDVNCSLILVILLQILHLLVLLQTRPTQLQVAVL